MVCPACVLNGGVTFNRTIVELKRYNQSFYFYAVNTFNRTIVELKHVPIQAQPHHAYPLLIEPLWN